MPVRIAINGFGRIGRNVLRAICETGRTDLRVVAVNDVAPPAINAHLLRYDSVHGRFPGEVEIEDDVIDVGAGPIKVVAEREIAKLPWRELDVELALECTGVFTKRVFAVGHLMAGARKVLISAPAEEADITAVYGVNHEQLKPEHEIVSCASCTTNCLAPVAKVLNEAVGIARGHMTTIHAFTNDQRLLDMFHWDIYRARGATSSLIPASTGAARTLGLVLPELEGRLDGVAIRVPVQNVSLVDLTFVPRRETSRDEINDAFRAAAEGPLAGVLAVTNEPLVSIDLNHDPHSSTVDLNATKVLEGRLVRVASWYDNEWGFSNRMCDVAAVLGRIM